MTDIAVTIAIIIVILIILTGFWELLAWWALGPVKYNDQEVREWLQEEIGLSLKQDRLFKLNSPENQEILFIKEHRLTLFSTYFVELQEGSFRVLRGSALHKRIEQKIEELKHQS